MGNAMSWQESEIVMRFLEFGLAVRPRLTQTLDPLEIGEFETAYHGPVAFSPKDLLHTQQAPRPKGQAAMC